MKKLILISFVLSLTLLMGSVSHAFAALDPLPLPRAPLNQRDRFSTDLFSGSANYSYPLKVPKGTNDLTPDVSLSYSSSGVRDLKTYLGIGWELNMDYVERDINYTPGSTSDDKFKLHFKGSVYDLVYVSGDSRYHTKIESNLNIQKLTGGSNDYGDYWQVITSDGTKYRFGYASQSELSCSGQSYVASWNLDQVTDIHDNKIYYTYTDNNGITYLSQIKYNNDQSRIIDFNYSTNPYEHPVYNQGCYAYDLKRLTNIQMKINTSLIREYDIAFGQTGNTQPVLDSITENGSDRSHLPATVLYYKPEIHTWNASSETWVNNAAIDVHLEKTDVVMADVTGDGLPDIVKSEGTSSNTWKVWRNTGSGWNTSTETWVNNVGMAASLGRSDTRLIDVTGDGLPDIVKSEAGSVGGKSYWYVWRNTGSSWNTTAETWVNNDFVDAYFAQTDVNLMDVNGDGLADIVKTTHDNNSTWFVYKNTGNNTWSTTKETWLQASINAHMEDHNVRLVDVNGDGLPDIVKTVYSGGTWSTWYVYKNTGSGWGSQTMWLDADVDAHFLKTDVALADANGDGLLDIVKSDELGGGTPDRWKVLMNRGGSWSSSWETWIDPSANLDLTIGSNTQLADVNGDGLSDIVSTTYSGGNDTWKVWKNNGVSPHLLASIHNPQGGVISFDYIKASGFDNTGSDDIADLPFPLWLVGTMTVNNGLDNTQKTEDVTTYSYKDGFYKWQDHEFRGFGTVNTAEPNGSKKQFVFNQDDALKGRLAEAQHRDSSNNPYTETEDTWSNSSSNGVYTVNLTQEKNYTYDGTASNPKVTQNDYTYDSYGNITKKSEQGDTGVSGDERFAYNEYIYNTTAWILNTVKHTYLNKDDDTTKISESWFYYDGNTGLSDTPAKGDVTKKVDWLSGGTNPETTYAYDSYGNQTSVTDANSHTTATAYDSSTHTYPISTTNAKSQTSTVSYDLGTGNLLSKTDPNSLTTSYEYDVYARLTKEIKPYDSSTYPSVKYQYFTDGVDGVLTSRREISGSSSATLDTYTWVDGLGRAIQARSEMEDTTKQTVVNTYYDPTGQIAKVSVPHQAGLTDYYANPETGIRSTDTSYDPIGRPNIITNPKGDNKTIAYDHWKATTIDENGHIKRQFKNAFDKITKVEEVNAGSTYTTTYVYDSRDLLTKITDNASHDSTFVYDTLGRKTSQTDPDMGTWTYGYDASGNLTSQTDARSITTTRNYDELNRLTKVDYPSNTDTTYLYDAYAKIGTMTIATDSAGMVTYLYDNRLRKTQEQRKVDSATKTTQFSYDAADRTVTQTNPDGEVITNAFNPQGEIESVTGSSSILSNINYNALGKITSKAYANGLTTNYTYNTNDFRLNRIQTGSLQDLNYTYDTVGNVNTITDSVVSKTQTFGYDDLDRLKAASESAGYNHAYAYDSTGNLTSFTNAGNTTNYSYGQNGKAHAMTASGELVSPTASSAATPFTSSLVDNWASGSIDASKWMNWGGSHVSVSSQQLNMTSNAGGGYYGVDSGINTNVYNLTGSSVVTKLVDAGNQALGSWEVYPLYAYVNGDTSNQYFWYVSGNTIAAYKRVSGSTNRITYTPYNSTNHKWFRIRESGGTTYFDTSANGTTWTNFTSVANPFNVTSMVIGSEVGSWSSEASTTSAIFDNFNYINPSTAALTDDWSSGSINSSVWSNWSGGQASVSNQQFRLTSTTGSGYYGVDSGVGSNTYNLTDSYVSTQLVDPGNLSLGSYEVYPLYAYTSGNSGNQYFWYINGTDLKAFKKVGGSNSPVATGTFNASQHKWFRIRESGGTTYFDTSADGNNWVNFGSTANAFNVTSMVIGHEIGTWSTEASTTAAIFDNFNYRTPAYTYDAAGNMTSDGKNCYEYNEANQLIKVKNCGNNVTIADYIYDFNGNRMVKKTYQSSGTLKDTTTSWTDSYETKVINGGATENTSYYFVNNELVAKKDNSGTKTYYHADHLGSTSLITNASGSLVENTSYYPYGEIRSGGTQNKFLYTDQERDTETGLDYYNARYYNDHIRRFTQPDESIQDAYNPQSLNRYSYVLNNPIRYTDPTGHFADEILDVAFIAADITAISEGGASGENVAALTADIGGALIPGVTGGGIAVRAIAHGGDIAEATSKYVKATEKLNIIQVEKQAPQIKQGSKGGPGASSRYIPVETRKQVKLENPQNICVFCRMQTAKPQLDHAIPVVKAGNSTPKNMQITCQHCNASKGSGNAPKTAPKGFKGLWPPKWWK